MEYKRRKAQAGTQEELFNMYDPGTQYFQTGYTQDAFGNSVPVAYDPMNASYDQAAQAEQFTTTNPMLPKQPSSQRKVTGQDYVKMFNVAATGVTGIANAIQNNKLKREEQFRLLEAMTPHYWENPEGEGLNKNPMYTKYGGSTVSAGKAKEILRDGTAQGHTLTDKQKRFFGWVAGGKKQTGGGVYNYLASKGIDGSLANRKKLFGKYFDNYTGTYEQNVKLLSDLESGKIKLSGISNSSLSTVAGKVAASTGKKASLSGAANKIGAIPFSANTGNPEVDRYIRNELSGHDKYMIVNRADNTMYYGKLGQHKKTKVGLGANNDPNAQKTAPVMGRIDALEKAGKYKEANSLKVTPLGSFAMQYTPDIYGYPAFWLKDNETGGSFIHARYSKKKDLQEYNRRKQLEKSGIWNYSYGCTNMADDGTCMDGKSPLEDVVSMFSHDLNRPDSARYIDTRLSREMNEKILKKIHKAGGCTDCNKQAGGEDDIANVIAESGEIVQGFGGNIVKVSDNANTHEQGGVPLKGVSKVLEDTSDKRKDKASKLLRMSPTEVKGLFNFKPKSSVSHAKAFELAVEHYDKTRNKIKRENKIINEKPYIDKICAKSAELNFKLEKSLPGEDDIYDALFIHQEEIKKMNNIQDDGTIAKCGGKYSMKAQAGTFRPYYDKRQKIQYTPPVGLTPDQFYTPEVLAYMNTLDKLEGVDNDMGLAKDNLWGYRHQQAYDKFFGTPTPVTGTAGPVTDKTGTKFVIPKSVYNQEEVSPYATKDRVAPSTDVTINPKFVTQPNNQFYEPTYWDDLAPSLLGLVDSLGRESELYNPMEFNQLRYKTLDPTPALNANQADYNAAVSQIDDPGVLAGLQAQKYAANAQILGAYENQNTQIKNNEISYNTEAKNRQSVADATTRGVYHRNVQLSREAQRQQRLKSTEDIARVVGLKRRQNASGNLILKLSPAYNQRGEYNGFQYVPVLPGDVAGTTNTQILQTATGKKFQIVTDANGKEISRKQIS